MEVSPIFYGVIKGQMFRAAEPGQSAREFIGGQRPGRQNERIRRIGRRQAGALLPHEPDARMRCDLFGHVRGKTRPVHGQGRTCPESEAWVRALGADFVINHHYNLPEQIVKLGIGAPSWAFSTNHSERYLPQLAELLAPQGRIALIDDPQTLDANPLKGKSISLHWEFMFTRPLRETADIARQGEILAKVAHLVDEVRAYSRQQRQA